MIGLEKLNRAVTSALIALAAAASVSAAPEVIVRGAKWRPVDMGKIDKSSSFPAVRMPGMDIVPGSVLDMSQYVPREDIDANGRIVSDADGNLRFENRPGVKVRLKGFNCVYGAWEDRFKWYSHDEIEAIAEQIRLSGMNLIRLHFWDNRLVGLNGFPKTGKDSRDFADVKLPQSADEIPIDEAFADRFWYFVKCLRERGIYLFPDIVTGRLWSGADKAKKGKDPRFGMYTDPECRRAWQAGFDYMMKTVNPYTGRRLIDDPQVVGVTCYNELEHSLILREGGSIERFSDEWRKSQCPDNPASVRPLDGRLLQENSETGRQARRFVRERMREVDAFFLSALKKSGFKGFAVCWDMYMRHLEGSARSRYDAVAMHTYCCHPGYIKDNPLPEPLPEHPEGKWFRDGRFVSAGNSNGTDLNNYLNRAAGVRQFGKPFFLTEYANSGCNRWCQQAPTLEAALPALQDWQMLCPHVNTVKREYLRYEPWRFAGAEDLTARVASVLGVFAWLRGDIAAATNAVAFRVRPAALDSPECTGAFGGACNGLAFLTRIGVHYGEKDDPKASLTFDVSDFAETSSRGLWADLKDSASNQVAVLKAEVNRLRSLGILSVDNATDVDKGLFVSETGELTVDRNRSSITIDTPRFQSMTVDAGGSAETSDIALKAASVPAGVTLVSLDAKRSIRDSRHLLLTVTTKFQAEYSSVLQGWKYCRSGSHQLVMQAGKFLIEADIGGGREPEVFALGFDGLRRERIAVKRSGGRVVFDLDTSGLEFGTPFFEVVFPGDGTRLEGRQARKLEKVFKERLCSSEAKGRIYDETVNAFVTNYDDSDAPGKDPWMKGRGLWQGEYWGKTMLSASAAAEYSGDYALKRWLRTRATEFVRRFQRPDGYLGSYRNADFVGVKNADGEEVFCWNLWGRKYTMWALIELSRTVRSPALLSAAKRMMDHEIRQIDRLGIKLTDTGFFAGMPSMSVLKPLMLLYSETKEKRYLDFARRIVGEWKRGGNPCPNLISNAFSEKMVHEWYLKPERWAKAYEMMSCLEGLVEWSVQTGDAQALEAVKKIVGKLEKAELNALCSVGFFDHFTHAASCCNANTELCDVIHWIRLNRELFLVTDDPHYLENVEKAYLNSFLAGVYRDGKWAAHAVRSHGSRHRTAPSQIGMTLHQCCVDNMPRTFKDIADTVVTETADGILSVNLYGDATVRRRETKLEISGDYPFSDAVTVRIVAEKAGRIRLRVPESFDEMKVDGEPVKGRWREIGFDKGERIVKVGFVRTPKMEYLPLKFAGDSRAKAFETADETPEMKGMARNEPAARITYGPLILAKGLYAKTEPEEIFRTRLDKGGEWKLSVLPGRGGDTDGSWLLRMERGGEVLSVAVSDFASVADRDDPKNRFSIWF